MKSELIERRYRMNRDTVVIIKSKKEKDADIYKNTVTLIQESVSIEPLRIGTREEIEAAIADINLEDEQVSLFAGDRG